MDRHNLNIYLNDHLAGSTAALEVLDVLEAMRGLESFARRLRAQISDDREQLLALMHRLSLSISTTRRIAAWFIEKIAEVKVGLEGDAPLKRFELLEALALGVDGKLALWCALEGSARADPGLAGLDYPDLKQRAAAQRHEIERRRIEAALESFGGATGR